MVTAIVDRLAELHARCPSRDLRPVHGAPHPDQWLDAGSEVGLIDFDRFSLGDPEMDAGVVLGDLDALAEPAVPPERLAAAFLEGYRAAGVTLREPLVQTYRAHQQLAKVMRAARAIDPGGDRRAVSLAARTDHLLSDAVRL
jgi:aminoglycoside phosphotransferase (APT) family kinase protein